MWLHASLQRAKFPSATMQALYSWRSRILPKRICIIVSCCCACDRLLVYYRLTWTFSPLKPRFSSDFVVLHQCGRFLKNKKINFKDFHRPSSYIHLVSPTLLNLNSGRNYFSMCEKKLGENELTDSGPLSYPFPEHFHFCSVFYFFILVLITRQWSNQLRKTHTHKDINAVLNLSQFP